MTYFTREYFSSDCSSYILQIDEEILLEVVKMGFDRNQLIESLRNRVQNEV